jgi:hypothetical protein
MQVDSKIFYILALDDWGPSDVTLFQGFAPGLIDHIPTMQSIVRFPVDAYDFALKRPTRLARRISGSGSWRWTPFNVSSLVDLEFDPRSPCCVIFSATETCRDAVNGWRNQQKLPVFHVGIELAGCDCRLEDVTPGAIAGYCRATLKIAKSLLPGLDVQAELEAIDLWIPPSPTKSPLTHVSHNVSVANEMVLLSEGYMPNDGPPLKSDNDYFSAIDGSASQVGLLRDEAGEPVAFRREPPGPDLILFAPAIYKGLEDNIARSSASLPVLTALRVMRRQRGFPYTFPINEATRSPLFRGALQARSQELLAQSAAVGVRAASTTTPTLRLPPSVNRTTGTLAHLSTHLRAIDQPKPVKTARVFRAVQNALLDGLTPNSLAEIRKSRSGVKIISDAPLEWLPVDGLPLGLRHDVSRINVTPGTLTFGELTNPAPIYIEPKAFEDFLILSSFKDDDPIKDSMKDTLEIATNANGIEIGDRFQRIASKNELIEKLNAFHGPMVIFDSHGGHDRFGVLRIGDEDVDIWQLRTLIRVPPIVILSACDTHPADKSHATVANGFIHCGARAVLATFLPVRSDQSARLIAKLLLRASVFTAAMNSSGRTALWSLVIGGLLRMQMVGELVYEMVGRGFIPIEMAPRLNLIGNTQINMGGTDWFEKTRSAYQKAAGLDDNAWKIFFDDYLAGSDLIRYTHVGNPETILVASRELLNS